VCPFQFGLRVAAGLSLALEQGRWFVWVDKLQELSLAEYEASSWRCLSASKSSE